MEKKNILMETEPGAESFCVPAVWLCFAWKLLKSPLPFIVFDSILLVKVGNLNALWVGLMPCKLVI